MDLYIKVKHSLLSPVYSTSGCGHFGGNDKSLSTHIQVTLCCNDKFKKEKKKKKMYKMLFSFV